MSSEKELDLNRSLALAERDQVIEELYEIREDILKLSTRFREIIKMSEDVDIPYLTIDFKTFLLISNCVCFVAGDLSVMEADRLREKESEESEE